MPTAAEWQAHLRSEIAPYITDDDACKQCRVEVSNKVVFLWDSWDDRETERLQYLYAKRSAIDWLLGHLWPLTNGSLGPLNERCKDKFDNLLKLRELTTLAIGEEEAVDDEPYEFHTVGELL